VVGEKEKRDRSSRELADDRPIVRRKLVNGTQKVALPSLFFYERWINPNLESCK